MSDSLQLINLFPASMRPKKDPLDWRHLQLYVFVLVTVMAIVYVWQWSTLQKQSQELTTARLNQQQLNNKLSELKASVPAGEKQRLENELKREKERLALLRESQNLYLQNVGDERRGFYGAMAAIANNAGREISIERILIQGKTRQLSLAGQANKAEFVPEYLRALQGEPALSGASFSELELSRNAGNIKFAMGTLVEGAKHE